MGKANKLNVRQQRFVDGIIAGKNATQAYLAAGYESTAHAARVSACELLAHPSVAAEIAERRAKVADRYEVTAASILRRLDQVADRCMEAEPVMEFDHLAGGMVQKTAMVEGEDGQARMVGVYEFDSSGANRALELLGKHKRLWAADAQPPSTTVFVLVAPGQAASPEKWAELVQQQAAEPRNLPEPR